MSKSGWTCLLGPALTLASAVAMADDRFDINRFQVEGNTLLSNAEVQRLVAPLAGRERNFGDVQKALESLELGYRTAGFSTVQVYVPEQELTSGTVILQVTEGLISNVTVSGNRHFSEDNIRGSLAGLTSGQPPNLRAISESIQLANDNPAKQVAITLATSDDGRRINADVKVTDNSPFRAFVTLDDTGAPATGRWRTGVALQYANLFDADHVGTLAYTTSPDRPRGVQVDLYSLGYRIPLYSIGDSVDLIFGKSNVSTPGASPTLGGVLGFTGKGDIYGLRWNHFLARQGERTSKLVVGLDRKQIDSRCSVNGVELSYAAPTPPISSCVPYETSPVSVTYSGQRQGVGNLIDYNIGLSHNVATGTRYTTLDGRTDRYSYLTPGNRNTVDGFTALRADASLLRGFAKDWQFRLAGSAQYANDPLVASEQFGLTGATTVRGFNERSVSADGGALVNGEIYTPELVARNGLPGNLRLLAFYDVGRGYNRNVGTSGLASHVDVSSFGAGARYAHGRNVNLRLDAARVIKAGTSTTEQRGDWNISLSATLGF